MSRFGVWILCCAVVLVAIATIGGDVNIHRLLSLLAYTGMPLLIHWCFSPRESNQG